MRLFAIALFFLFATSVSAQVYKCPNAAGKIEYSDRPCENAQTVNVQGNSGMESAHATPIKKGMSENQVRSIWGNPVRANGGEIDQWIYERDSQRYYVYFKNGNVYKVDNAGATSSVPSERAASSGGSGYKSILQREAEERDSKAGERRMIREGMSQQKVRSQLGEPANKDFYPGKECWSYPPSENDSQTRTTVCFDNSGNVMNVDRKVER